MRGINDPEVGTPLEGATIVTPPKTLSLVEQVKLRMLNVMLTGAATSLTPMLGAIALLFAQSISSVTETTAPELKRGGLVGSVLNRRKLVEDIKTGLILIEKPSRPVSAVQAASVVRLVPVPCTKLPTFVKAADAPLVNKSLLSLVRFA